MVRELHGPTCSFTTKYGGAVVWCVVTWVWPTKINTYVIGHRFFLYCELEQADSTLQNLFPAPKKRQFNFFSDLQVLVDRFLSFVNFQRLSQMQAAVHQQHSAAAVLPQALSVGLHKRDGSRRLTKKRWWTICKYRLCCVSTLLLFVLFVKSADSCVSKLLLPLRPMWIRD